MSCASTSKLSDKQEEQPLQYSYLTPKINIDSLMPPNMNIVDTNQTDFDAIPLDTGKLITIYKDTLKIPSGILISAKKSSLYIFYKGNSEYLDKKAMLSNKLYVELYDNSLKAEKIYQKEIEKLSKKVERTWLEKNIAYFGFVAGIVTAILTEYAVIQASK
jgi:hypothetical protein